MPVVINEFEIVPAAEPAKEPAAAPNAKPPAASSETRSQDIERALRRFRERAMRLRAH